MRLALNTFKFSTLKFKAAKLKEYNIPALESANTKLNTLWLHGLFDNSKNFLNVAQKEQLRKTTNQTLLDARNHGLSQHLETITFEEMAYDLVEYIAKKDLKDLILLGHSMGGRTIMAALNDYPNFLSDRVKGVIIVDVMPSSYAFAGSGPIDQMYRFMTEMKSINIHGKTINQVKEDIKSKFEQESLQKTMLNNIQVLPNGQLKWCINFSAFERSFNDILSHETKDCFWRGPRKVIIGGKSKFTSLERVKNDFPSVFFDFNLQRDVTVFENSAHFLYAKEPDRFVDEVTSFIKRVQEEDSPQIENEHFINEGLALEI
ncbi:alpha/beta fold hydrolase (macronuclear) [Tetrahymena thermophila SB210]|uniref:Alpha/beta fold hydrolase n=1 Tax=Tetrahymena thermophila (strain SB210) TaxID=312017 RepID=I7LSX0_TETTS|nr:alpha/beta fold hydrolase [Tetrahymena thermophila SB210]EAR83774.1 alpha/beta fold hydrolase [Tetrahymena thermophila SB210]|eukprot:XP_001031437.1 alpha/beta fold hydrolase [Tetrahymena thermophila SB210]